jgi:hypothetical protein
MSAAHPPCYRVMNVFYDGFGLAMGAALSIAAGNA